MAEEEKEQEQEEGKKGGASTMKIVIISVVLALFIGGGLVGTTFYFVSSMNDEPTASTKNDAGETDEEEEPEEDTEPDKPPQYISMDPKFVVSFKNQNKARFMQFSIEIMTRDSDVIKKVETHMPVIRSNLLMLVSSQTYEEMTTREGKEQLLQAIATDVNNSLQSITGEDQSDAIEAAYFNSFVIQ